MLSQTATTWAQVGDISGAHKYSKTPAAGTAAALLAGCDINSGGQYSAHIGAALLGGLVNESVVDAALINAFSVRIRERPRTRR